MKFFQQNCPICGRPVKMKKKLKFMMVVCNHCGGNFKASGRSEGARVNTILPVSQGEKIDALLRKSDRVLRLGKIGQC